MLQHKMFMWRRVIQLSATFLLLLVLVASCKKKDSPLGLNDLDQNNLLNSAQVDTFQLETYTIAEDSVITDNPAFAVLGSYVDPKFGSVNANFYTQLVPSGLNPDFGDLSTITIDSVVLGLEYVGFTGDLYKQTLQVFEMSEDIHLDSTYYQFTTKNVFPTSLIQPNYQAFKPDPNGVTSIGGDTVDTQLRIRLKNSFGKKFMIEAQSGSDVFSSTENFTNYFKGLHVRVNNPGQPAGKGGVFYFNLNDPLSKMTIYYRQDGLDKTYDLLINTDCADFNHVDITNAGTPVQTVINDTVSGMKEYYCQAFRSRAVVNMPSIKNLPKNAVIHKAELLLPIQYQTGSKYIPSTELTISAKVDDALSGIGVFGLMDFFNKQYVVNVRNFMQAYVSGRFDKTELYISPRFFITSAERVIFNGPMTINKKKPRLVVTYTEF